MKYFLATYEIIDGEHEHKGAVILKAETEEQAGKLAEEEEFDHMTDNKDFISVSVVMSSLVAETTGVRKSHGKRWNFWKEWGLRTENSFSACRSSTNGELEHGNYPWERR